MKRYVTRILMLLIGLAILGAVVYAFLPQPVVVDVAEVVRGPMVVTVNEDGQTRIRERYVISAPLAGQVQRITLRAGDRVQAGETILTTIAPSDPALLDARTVAEAESRVRAAQAALRRAEPIREQARAELDFAENELARLRSAHERGAATARELDAAHMQLRTATEGFNAAQLTVEIARYELEVAEAAFIRTRPDGIGEVEHMSITAPVDGSVLRVFQESMAVVSPGTPLVEIGDSADLEMVIDVLTTDAVQIAPGTRVLVEHWGGPHELEGRVRLVEPRAFTKVSALGVEEQRVNVIADFVEPLATDEPSQPSVGSSPLGDGYRIEARIVIWETDDAIQAPSSALFRVGSPPQWAVYVMEDGRARRRRVSIGRQTGLHVEVLDGLAPGEIVIVHPSDDVKDGVQVEVGRRE